MLCCDLAADNRARDPGVSSGTTTPQPTVEEDVLGTAVKECFSCGLDDQHGAGI